MLSFAKEGNLDVIAANTRRKRSLSLSIFFMEGEGRTSIFIGLRLGREFRRKRHVLFLTNKIKKCKISRFTLSAYFVWVWVDQIETPKSP